MKRMEQPAHDASKLIRRHAKKTAAAGYVSSGIGPISEKMPQTTRLCDKKRT
jgi:hypothetical protein